MKIRGIEIDGVLFEIGRPIAADPDYTEAKKGIIAIHFEKETHSSAPTMIEEET